MTIKEPNKICMILEGDELGIFPYIVMTFVSIVVIFSTVLLAKKSRWALALGCLAWISSIFYFALELVVIRASLAPYDFLKQPMSDLGVTVCGTYTYAWASYEICSPLNLLMNWTFVITGLTTAIGAICLQAMSIWPNTRKIRIATGLLIVFGLSMSIAGIIPADKNFIWHTLVSLPGMFVQIPALILIGKAIRCTRPKLAKWTFFCVWINILILALIFLQPVIGLPGGLLQRLLYGSVYLWTAVTGLVVWREQRKRQGE